jgi:hypothetical protein
MTWILTIIALAGTVANVKKMKVCFVLWIITNIGWLAFDLSQGLFSRATLDIVQLILAIAGWFEWSKKEKEKEKLPTARVGLIIDWRQKDVRARVVNKAFNDGKMAALMAADALLEERKSKLRFCRDKDNHIMIYEKLQRKRR